MINILAFWGGERGNTVTLYNTLLVSLLIHKRYIDLLYFLVEQALTPNLLARTIETVEGGGLVILLLKTVNSLKQLYTMSMDVHSRFALQRRIGLY